MSSKPTAASQERLYSPQLHLAYGMLQADRLHTHPRVSLPVVSFIVSLSMASLSHREQPHPVTNERNETFPTHCQKVECETVRAGHFKKKNTRTVGVICHHLHPNHNFKCANGVKLWCLKKLQSAPWFNWRSQERRNVQLENEGLPRLQDCRVNKQLHFETGF